MRKIQLNKKDLISLLGFISIILLALLSNSKDSNITVAMISIVSMCYINYNTNYNITISNYEVLLVSYLSTIFISRYVSTKEFICSYDILAYILFYFFMKVHAIFSCFPTSIVLTLILVGIYEALFGIISSNIQNGGIIGHFNNPAGYAAFFTGLSPLAHYLLHLPNKNYKIIGGIAVVVFAIAIILSKSRAGIISLLIYYIIILYIKSKKKHIFSILMFGIICFIGYFLYAIKIHSAIGRLLIWENSLRLISDAPWLGHGINGFTSKYMLYQAEYFRENPHSKFAMLADDIMYPFNEYFGFIIRYGLIIFAFIISGIFTLCKRNFKNIHKRYFVLSLICISIFALFSYPLEYVAIQLIIVVDIFFLISCQSSTNRLIKLKKNLIIMIPLFILLLYQTTKSYINNKKCIELEIKTANIDVIPKSVVLEYERVKKDNLLNPFFLFNYGAISCRNGDYKKSIALFSECKKYLNNSQVQLFLSENYINLKQYDKAEYHALQASYMYPSLFRPLYYLNIIYDKTGQVEKAKIMAQQIINKPMKVLNFDSSLIKAKMEEYLTTNKLP